MLCPSLQRQIPPSRKVLLLYHHLPVFTLSCLPQKHRTVEWKKQKILWHLGHQNRFVVTGWIPNSCTWQKPPTSLPRLNAEAKTSRETQPQGGQPCPSHRAELMLKSQWKGKDLSTNHFPSRCLLSVAWCSLRAAILDFMSLQSNVEVPAQCLEKGKQHMFHQDYHALLILLLGVSCTCLLIIHNLHALSLTFYHKTVECLSFISTHGFLRFLY